MHAVDFILLALIAAGAFLGVRHSLRHPGCQKSCGDCSACAGCRRAARQNGKNGPAA